MPSLVHGTLILWLVVVPCAFFSRIPRHLVVSGALLLGLLFLPMVSDGAGLGDDGPFAALALPGLKLSKYNVISLAILLGVLIADTKSLATLRLSWLDLPMIVWCLCPLPSVLGADPPPDGSSPLKVAVNQVFTCFLNWGTPYFIGKLYFGSRERLRDLAVVFLLGALLYVPFCLFEIRMSPQLHSKIYGFTQHDFLQTIRFEGFRPMVFMQHGLAVGFFLASASLVGAVLWWSGAARDCFSASFLSKYGDPVPYAVALVAVTTFLAKSSGAVLLAAVGLVVLVSVFLLKTRWLLAGLLLVCPLYLTARTAGVWSGSTLVPTLKAALDEDRAESFEFRQTNEDKLMERAFEGPPFGWAGWGRNFVHDKQGQSLTVPDGLWIITLGQRGLPGLIALFLAVLIPVACFVCLQTPADWPRAPCAAATACALVVALYMVDNLLNDMYNPMFVLMAGGLAGLPARVPAPAPPRQLSVTDPKVFRWSLYITRLGRRRLGSSLRSDQ